MPILRNEKFGLIHNFRWDQKFHPIKPQTVRKRLRQREPLEIPRAVAICCRCCPGEPRRLVAEREDGQD